MEETTKKSQEIIFSKAIKAGKRIYYMDVKSSKNGELYLAVTESKKVVAGDPEAPNVTFEKHKLFLYKEDFEKFMSGLQESIEFIEKNQGKALQRPEYDNDEIKIDLEFWHPGYYS